jgi:hypothetical protein
MFFSETSFQGCITQLCVSLVIDFGTMSYIEPDSSNMKTAGLALAIFVCVLYILFTICLCWVSETGFQQSCLGVYTSHGQRLHKDQHPNEQNPGCAHKEMVGTQKDGV